MAHINTYQDFVSAKDKLEFIARAIVEYRGGELHRIAVSAQNYYARKNDAILSRMSYLERSRKPSANVTYHKLCNGFFPKFVKQLNSYLLGNGITLDEKVKEHLGERFDKTLLVMGSYALVDGVCWGLWDADRKLVPFRATEFFALPDERTGNPMIGIRFWQIDAAKPLYVELYEHEGVTVYKSGAGAKLEEVRPRRPYKTSVRKDILGEDTTGIANYDVLPIFPLYANDLRQSELIGLKGYIDAYDFVSSDLIDSITLVDGLYWIVKNYGGDDLSQLITEIQERRTIYTDGAESSAASAVVESPFQSKMETLQFLENRMFADFMVPTSASMRAVTATEINVNREPFDLKTDNYEMQVVDFVENLLRLLGVEDAEPKFKRRTMNNDSETVTNIYAMRQDIDRETALFLNPLVPDDMVAEIMERKVLEEMGASGAESDGEPAEDEETSPGDVSSGEAGEAVEDVAGKTLTGIQTTSLIGVIEKYTAGALTLQQAINIVSVSIGVSKEEAKRIIEGLE